MSFPHARRLGILTLVSAALLCVATPVRAQDDHQLAGLLLDLLSQSGRNSTTPTTPHIQRTTIPHEMHFIPGLSLQLTPRELNKAIGLGLTTFPLPSSAGGFAYTTDPATGEIRLATTTFGPVYAERAFTIGKRRFDFGLAFQPTSFDSFETAELSDGSMQFILEHNNCCPGMPADQNAPSLPTSEFRQASRIPSTPPSNAICCGLRFPSTSKQIPRCSSQITVSRIVSMSALRFQSSACRWPEASRPRSFGRPQSDRPDIHNFNGGRMHSPSPRHVPPPAWATYCCARSTTSCGAAAMRSPPRSIFACRQAMKTTCWEPARRRRSFSSSPPASTGCSPRTRASVTRSPTGKSAISRRMWTNTVGSDVPGRFDIPPPSFDPSVPDEVNYTFGFSAAAHPRLTLGFDFIGRTIRDVFRFDVARPDVANRGPGDVPPGTSAYPSRRRAACEG